MSETGHEDWVRSQASAYFNRVWELLEIADRTPEQSQEMLTAAHASRSLWGLVGSPDNFAIGDWQISRVYAVLNEPTLARVYAMSGLEICTKERLGPFLTGYALESLSRAALVSGYQDEAIHYMKSAFDLLDLVSNPDDKKYLEDDLNDIKQQIEGQD